MSNPTNPRVKTQSPNVYDYDPYLKNSHLQGKTVTLQIIGIHDEEFPTVFGGSRDDDAKTERRPVLEFAKTKKLLPLNKTQRNKLAQMFGPQMEKWLDQHISLKPARKSGKDTIEISAAALRAGQPAAPEVKQPELPEAATVDRALRTPEEIALAANLNAGAEPKG